MSEDEITSPKTRRSNISDQTNQNSVEMDFKLAYSLEKRNVKLQSKANQRTEELLEYLTKVKSNLQSHKTDWSNYCSNMQTKLTAHENIWDIFHHSENGIDAYIQQTEYLIRRLKLAKRELSEINQNESFKSKVEQERATLTKLEQKKAELDAVIAKTKKDEEKEQKNLAKSKKSSANTSWNCIKPQEEQLDFYQRQISLESTEQRLQERIKKEKEKFCQRQKDLFGQFKDTEIKRCEMLKEHSKKYFEAFQTTDEEFSKSYDNYNGKTDIENWEKHIFKTNSKTTS